MLDCEQIAQDMSPKDTGNLAFNALTTVPTRTGFKLVYQYVIADYMHFLNDGTIHSTKHQGWADKVAKQVASYINMDRNGKRNTLSAAKGRISQYPDTERRQRTMMASISRNVRSGYVGTSE